MWHTVALARELPHARMIQASSIYEWRLAPTRLDEALVARRVDPVPAFAEPRARSDPVDPPWEEPEEASASSGTALQDSVLYKIGS